MGRAGRAQIIGFPQRRPGSLRGDRHVEPSGTERVLRPDAFRGRRTRIARLLRIGRSFNGVHVDAETIAFRGKGDPRVPLTDIARISDRTRRFWSRLTITRKDGTILSIGGLPRATAGHLALACKAGPLEELLTEVRGVRWESLRPYESRPGAVDERRRRPEASLTGNRPRTPEPCLATGGRSAREHCERSGRSSSACEPALATSPMNCQSETRASWRRRSTHRPRQ